MEEKNKHEINKEEDYQRPARPPQRPMMPPREPAMPPREQTPEPFPWETMRPPMMPYPCPMMCYPIMPYQMNRRGYEAYMPPPGCYDNGMYPYRNNPYDYYSPYYDMGYMPGMMDEY